MGIRFCQIRHKERKGDRVYTSYLGDVQIDTPHVTRFYSKSTNEIVEVTVDSNGEVSKKVIKSKARVTCPDSIAIIEVGDSESLGCRVNGDFKSKRPILRISNQVKK